MSPFSLEKIYNFHCWDCINSGGVNRILYDQPFKGLDLYLKCFGASDHIHVLCTFYHHQDGLPEITLNPFISSPLIFLLKKRNPSRRLCMILLAGKEILEGLHCFQRMICISIGISPNKFMLNLRGNIVLFIFQDFNIGNSSCTLQQN